MQPGCRGCVGNKRINKESMKQKYSLSVSEYVLNQLPGGNSNDPSIVLNMVQRLKQILHSQLGVAWFKYLEHILKENFSYSPISLMGVVEAWSFIELLHSFTCRQLLFQAASNRCSKIHDGLTPTKSCSNDPDLVQQFKYTFESGVKLYLLSIKKIPR